MVSPIEITTAPTYTLITVTAAGAVQTETSATAPLAARKGVTFRNGSAGNIQMCNSGGTSYLTLEPGDSVVYILDGTGNVVFYYQTAQTSATYLEREEWK